MKKAIASVVSVHSCAGQPIAEKKHLRIDPGYIGQIANQTDNALGVELGEWNSIHKALYKYPVQGDVEFCVIGMLYWRAKST